MTRLWIPPFDQEMTGVIGGAEFGEHRGANLAFFGAEGSGYTATRSKTHARVQGRAFKKEKNKVT